MQKSPYKQLMRDRGICVVIPTYNNVGTIADVVNRTIEQCDDVIVVNDGSNDGTEDVLRSIDGITLVDYKKNAGKGTALKRGFQKAIELGFAYAITLDGDGQHYPEDIPLLVEGNIANPGCLLIGQRKLEGVERTKGSKFANSFSNFWFCVQTLHYLPDTQTGYRLYPLKKLYGLSMLTSRYEAELELLVFSSWHGVKIVPIPVNVYYPPIKERVSHFRPGPDFARISVLNTFLCILAVVYALPLAIIRFMIRVIYTIIAILVYLVGAIFILTPFAFINVCISKLTKRKTSTLNCLLNWFGKLVVGMFNFFGIPAKIRNKYNEDFEKPALMICNHQSHLDLMIQLSLTTKMVFLTNDWVWNSPFFGYIVRNAEYYPVSMGIEELLPRLKSLVDRGYSISVFPEGTRSYDCSIGRFHKGAFHIAEELKLDILPLVLYGAGKVLPKKGLYIRHWPMLLSIEKRISPEMQNSFGESLREKCKNFRKYYKQRYSELSNEIEQNV